MPRCSAFPEAEVLEPEDGLPVAQVRDRSFFPCQPDLHRAGHAANGLLSLLLPVSCRRFSYIVGMARVVGCFSSACGQRDVTTLLRV